MASDIRTYSLVDLEQYFVQIGEPIFRAKQVYEWLWKRNAQGFDQMTNLSKPLRIKLSEAFVIAPISVDVMQRSQDGTIKNAVRLSDDNMVESVLIPTNTRSTACVSSQVGCSLDCKFCATATLKRMRNLTAAEIVDQVALIDRQSRLYFDRPLSNIVFMGMGEPLLNYNALVEAIDKITSKDGLAMSPKRITVSTSGIPKMIKKLADEQLGIKLALSLHSAIESKRQSIMPFSESIPMADLVESLQYWYRQTKNRITIEYIVWENINDTAEDIQALVNFCKKVPTKVNLIQYNSIDDDGFRTANSHCIKAYIDALERHDIVAKIRQSRGGDIDAACGQLANKTNHET